MRDIDVRAGQYVAIRAQPPTDEDSLNIVLKESAQQGQQTTQRLGKLGASAHAFGDLEIGVMGDWAA